MKNIRSETKCRLARKAYFSAAVKSPHGQLSGHNYVLEVYVEGPLHLQSGMIIAVQELAAIIEKTTSHLDHSYINELAEFAKTPASLENIAQYCYYDIKKNIESLPGLWLQKIRLNESEDVWVDVEESEGA